MPERMQRAAVALSLLTLLVTLAGGVASAQPVAGPASVWVTSRGRTDVGLAATTQLQVLDVDLTDPKGPTGGGRVRATTMGTIAHAPDAVVRAEAVHRSGRFVGVAVVADERPGRSDFGAALVFLPTAPGSSARLGEARRLTTGVMTATRPLATADGLIYVQRGVAGLPPTREAARRGELRVDSLEIDAIDPESGAVRVVTTWQGYTTHLAGALSDDLVVYRVGPRGADIARVDRASGKTRVVADVVPFARDFTVDESRHALVFSNRDEVDPTRWGITRLDLDSGASSVLARAVDEAPIPYALEGGAVVATERGPDRHRLRALTAPPAAPAPVVLSAALPAALGRGPAFVTRARRDGAWWAISHVGGGTVRFDRVTLYAPRTGRAIELPTETARIEVVGFVDDVGVGVGVGSGGLR